MQYRWEFLLVVCILTRPTGSPKYGTTRKNTQRYYTTKRLIRYIYPTRANGIIVLVNSQTGFWRRFLFPQFYKAKIFNLALHFPYNVKLRLLAHSRSFLANQKARNAIVGAENLLNNYNASWCLIKEMEECRFGVSLSIKSEKFLEDPYWKVWSRDVSSVCDQFFTLRISWGPKNSTLMT